MRGLREPSAPLSLGGRCDQDGRCKRNLLAGQYSIHSVNGRGQSPGYVNVRAHGSASFGKSVGKKARFSDGEQLRRTNEKLQFLTLLNRQPALVSVVKEMMKSALLLSG